MKVRVAGHTIEVDDATAEAILSKLTEIGRRRADIYSTIVKREILGSIDFYIGQAGGVAPPYMYQLARKILMKYADGQGFVRSVTTRRRTASGEPVKLYIPDYVPSMFHGGYLVKARHQIMLTEQEIEKVVSEYLPHVRGRFALAVAMALWKKHPKFRASAKHVRLVNPVALAHDLASTFADFVSRATKGNYNDIYQEAYERYREWLQ